MHFCVLAARRYGRLPVPRNTSLNWFMPALVNSSVGSSCGTTLEDGTNMWLCLSTKKSMNCWRIWLAESMDFLLVGPVFNRPKPNGRLENRPHGSFRAIALADFLEYLAQR